MCSNVRQPRITMLGCALLFSMMLAGCGASDSERLERAATALQAGDFRAASIDAKSVLQNEPGSLTARLILAESSLNLGDGASAEKELRRAFELGADKQEYLVALAEALFIQAKSDELLEEILPEEAASETDKAILYALRGESFLSAGENDQATAAFDAALAADPANVEAKLGLARQAFQLGDSTTALQRVDVIKQSHPNSIPAAMLAGEISLLGRDFERAVDEFSLVVDQPSTNNRKAAASAGRFDAYIALGDLDKASESLGTLAKLIPRAPVTTLRQGQLAFAKGDWTVARDHLLTTLNEAPDSVLARRLLGVAHYQLEEYAQAEVQLSAVAGRLQKDYQTRLILAETRRKLDRNDEVDEALASVFQTSNDVQVLSSATRLTMASQGAQSALEVAKSNVQRFPEDASLRLDLATAYVAAGDPSSAADVLAALDDIESAAGLRRDVLNVLVNSQSGKVTEARALAEQLTVDYPQVAMGYVLSADIAIANGEDDLGRTLLEKAISLDPDDVAPLLGLASLEGRLGNYQRASELLVKSLGIRPGNIEAMIALAELSIAERDVDSAKGWLQEAILVDGGSSAPAEILVRLHMVLGESGEAETLLDTMMEKYPERASFLYLKGALHMANNRPDLAVESLRQAIEVDPGTPDYYRALATAQMATSSSQAAIATLEQGRSNDATSMRGDMLLAYLYLNSNERARAQQVVSERRASDPTAVEPVMMQAEIAISDGETDKAVAMFEQVYAQQPSWGVALRHAEIATRAGFDGSLQLLQQFSEANPLHAPSKVVLGQALYEGGRAQEAIEVYETASSIEAPSAAVLNNLAWLYQQRGDDRAVTVARRALEIEPNNPAIKDTLGWILVQDGATAEGLALLQESHEKAETNPDIAYHLAYALNQSGDTAAATQVLAKALAEKRFFSRDDALELQKELAAQR
ncbi:MAG: XrtA/PEP-CTERM system TPR-repeat protein PrsT [Pseudomonadota bacterium]